MAMFIVYVFSKVQENATTFRVLPYEKRLFRPGLVTDFGYSTFLKVVKTAKNGCFKPGAGCTEGVCLKNILQTSELFYLC